MKRPASQFYWGDWLACKEVRAVSLAARGLWIDMLAFMRQGSPLGTLTHRDGQPISAAQLARLVGESGRVVGRLLAELERAGVPGKAANGAFLCRRMIRDEQAYERYCAGQAVAGKRGAAERWGSPSAPQPGAHVHPIPDPNNPEWGKHASSSPSSSPSSSSSPKRSSRKEESRRGAPPPPPTARSKRPIFSGQRLVVFEWMLDDAMRLLGPLAEAFDLHSWFFDLDAQAVARGLVMPKRDGGEWLQAQLLAECERRGLPLRLARAAPDPVDATNAITRSIRAKLGIAEPA